MEIFFHGLLFFVSNGNSFLNEGQIVNKHKFILFLLPLLLLTITDVKAQDIVGSHQLVSYYDLRSNRESLVQVSNASNTEITIFVEIYQNNLENCAQLNFFDTLTSFDTHTYDMRNLEGNELPVNIELANDANGFVLISVVDDVNNSTIVQEKKLIGNFRLIDASGFEYRLNSFGNNLDLLSSDYLTESEFTNDFDQTEGRNVADMIGIVLNVSDGNFIDDTSIDFNVSIFGEDGFNTVCNNFQYSCGGQSDTMNTGIDFSHPSPFNDNQNLCATSKGNGFVQLRPNEELTGDKIFIGFSGLNNGNGLGGMFFSVNNFN